MKIGYCAPACYIREVKEAGFDYIELPLCSIAAETDQSFEKILAQLKSENLPCLASNMFLPKSVRVTGNDVNLKSAAAYCETALSRAQRLGNRAVVLGSFGARNVPGGFPMEKAWRQFEEFGRMAGEIAAKHDVVIVLEPINGTETNLMKTVIEGVALARKINHPYVKALADYFHMQVEKEGMSSILAAGDDLYHTHTAALVGRSLPLEYDQEIQSYFIKALKQIGYRGALSIETADYRQPLSEMRQSLSLLQSLAEQAEI